jgi:uncharacterized protein
MSFEIYPDYIINIKPWNCKYCNYYNINHPFYCNFCDTINSYSINEENTEYKNIDKINKVKNSFNKTNNILLPVLSCNTKEQFINNINILYPYYINKKISGIFLLSSNIELEEFYDTYEYIINNYLDLWIGINLIGENMFTVLNFIKKYNPNGIWMDNSYLNNIGLAELFLNYIKKFNWNGLYFGGIMFKYQLNYNVYDVNILNICHKYMDVLTTSGDKTGIEIKNDKLNFIYDNVKNNILIAVASGIKYNNINDKINIFIVKSSIINDDNNIDINKLNLLIHNL